MKKIKINKGNNLNRPLGLILRNVKPTHTDDERGFAFEIIRSVFSKHIGNIGIADIDLIFEIDSSLPRNIDKYNLKKALKFDSAIFKLMMLLRNRGEKLSNLGTTINGTAAGFSDQYDKGAKGIAYLILPLNRLEQEKLILFSTDKYGFSLKYPQKWEIQYGQELVFYPPDAEKIFGEDELIVVPNVSLMQGSYGGDPTVFYEKYPSEINKTYNQFELVSKEIIKTHQNFDALMITFKFISLNDSLKTKSIILAVQNKFSILNCTSLDSNFDKYEKIFYEIISSFTIRNNNVI